MLLNSLKLSLLIWVLLPLHVAMGQGSEQSYQFEFLNEAYQPLPSPMVLNPGINSPGNDNYTVPLGFEFEFYGQGLHSIKVQRNGLVYLGTRDESIIPFRPELMVTPASQIGYQIDGGGPCQQRILKVEWRNMGVICQDSILGEASFQLWIYEHSHRIELHYGPQREMPAGTVCYATRYTVDGPGLRIRNAKMAMVLGDYEQPIVVQDTESLRNHQETTRQLGVPPSGMVYRFTPTYVVEEPALRAGPNPSQGTLNVYPRRLTCGPYRLTIADLLGRVYIHTESSAPKLPLDLTGLASGWYILRIQYLDNSESHGVKFYLGE